VGCGTGSGEQGHPLGEGHGALLDVEDHGLLLVTGGPPGAPVSCPLVVVAIWPMRSFPASGVAGLHTIGVVRGPAGGGTLPGAGRFDRYFSPVRARCTGRCGQQAARVASGAGPAGEMAVAGCGQGPGPDARSAVRSFPCGPGAPPGAAAKSGSSARRQSSRPPAGGSARFRSPSASWSKGSPPRLGQPAAAGEKELTPGPAQQTSEQGVGCGLARVDQAAASLSTIARTTSATATVSMMGNQWFPVPAPSLSAAMAIVHYRQSSGALGLAGQAG
jgi:hypothetical protein